MSSDTESDSDDNREVIAYFDPETKQIVMRDAGEEDV